MKLWKSRYLTFILPNEVDYHGEYEKILGLIRQKFCLEHIGEEKKISSNGYRLKSKKNVGGEFSPQINWLTEMNNMFHNFVKISGKWGEKSLDSRLETNALQPKIMTNKSNKTIKKIVSVFKDKCPKGLCGTWKLIDHLYSNAIELTWYLLID